jgi:hypothetical protein
MGNRSPVIPTKAGMTGERLPKWIDGFDLFKVPFDHTDYAVHARSGNSGGRKDRLGQKDGDQGQCGEFAVYGLSARLEILGDGMLAASMPSPRMRSRSGG